jgi:tRNA pseudouridine38-40 synthase
VRNFKLVIEYDGAAYSGWQRQKEDRTIQGEIENALQIMTREKVVLIGSGRTDAGVHALGQTANFKSEARISPEAFQKGLNSLLDGDIAIKSCESVPLDFHARFDVVKKAYRYRISNRSVPPAVGRQYVWHIRRPLDANAMAKAAARFVGEHDFKAFEGTGSPRASTVRRLFKSELSARDDGLITYDIEANGFLRFMVRNIVGTLAEVGRGKIGPEDIPRIFESGDRSLAGATAPPQGLFLVSVDYP